MDHREGLFNERTRVISRLRWHLQELEPGWQPTARSLDRASVYDTLTIRFAGADGTVARLARRLVERFRDLTGGINDLKPRSRWSSRRLPGHSSPSSVSDP